MSAAQWESGKRAAGFEDSTVDLRPLKRTVRGLPADHPARIAVLNEPDELPRAEYAGRLPVWFDLLKLRAG